MINLTATKPALKVVFDQCGTPTYALDLAHVIITIIEKPQVGVSIFRMKVFALGMTSLR